MFKGDTPFDAADTDAPHPAVIHFTRRVHELINQWNVVPTGHGRRPRNLTAKKVHDLLVEQAPSVAPSQSQLYRFCRGEAAPSIVDVLELARFFNVSPQSFLPETAQASEVHLRLQRPRHLRG
jgi:Helix-turn-helix